VPADDPDDETRGLPPDPLDRLWFHPSELSTQAETPAAPAARPARRDWGFGLVAAVVGALTTVVALAAAGVLDSGGSSVSTQGLVTGVPALSSDSAGAVAAAAAGLVTVRVTSADPNAPVATVSGIALSREQVLTSAAALTGAATVTVSGTGRAVTAQVVGTDPQTDIALLHVKDADLVAARLGSGGSLAVGQTVIGVGVTGADDAWATRGIVSARNRPAAGPTGMMAGLVATDLRIDPPALGGALLDASGGVVGLLSSAAPGHAVPIDEARDVADDLATTGRAHHGWLGVEVVDDLSRTGGGAYILAVAPGSPAEVAGLVPGDVVTTMAGSRITDQADVTALVSRRRPGDPLSVVGWRGAERLRRDATLSERGGLDWPTPAGGLAA